MRPSSMTPAHARAARLAYVVIILVATLSNLYPDWALSDVPPRLARAFQLTLHMSDAIDAARNVLLFAGLGAVWVATSRLVRPWSTLVRITLISFFFSAAIEALQLFSPVRESSIMDVTTNTIGGLVGGVATLAAFRLVGGRLAKRSFLGVPALVFAIAYSLATLAETFFPLFRQDQLPNLGGSVGDRIGRAIAAMHPVPLAEIGFRAVTTDTLIFAPAGVFAVLALTEAGVPAVFAALIAIVAAIVVYPGTEVLHGVTGIPIVVTVMQIHVIATSLGAIATAVLLPALGRVPTRSRARGMAIAYAAALSVWSWRPFRLDLSTSSMAEQFTSDHLVPLKALASRGDLFSVTDVLAQGLLFVSLGALLAVWPVRRTGVMRGLLPAIYLSIVLEVGKIPIAERFMDVTHILIQCAGAAIGFLLVRRVGYQARGTLLDSRSA